MGKRGIIAVAGVGFVLARTMYARLRVQYCCMYSVVQRQPNIILALPLPCHASHLRRDQRQHHACHLSTNCCCFADGVLTALAAAESSCVVLTLLCVSLVVQQTHQQQSVSRKTSRIESTHLEHLQQCKIHFIRVIKG